MTTIADVIRAGITAGMNNADILVEVKAKFPAANTSPACVSYYRSKMKKSGATPSKSKAVAKAAADADTEMAKNIANGELAKLVAETANIATYTADKIKTFNGMEGKGYNAILYRNGVKVATLIDDASGAPVMIDWVDAIEEKAMALYASQQAPYEFNGQMLDVTVDLVVEQVVNAHLILKDLKRHAKTKVVGYLNGDILTFKATPTEVSIAAVRKHNDGIVIINGMTDSQLLDVIYKNL